MKQFENEILDYLYPEYEFRVKKILDPKKNRLFSKIADFIEITNDDRLVPIEVFTEKIELKKIDFVYTFINQTNQNVEDSDFFEFGQHFFQMIAHEATHYWIWFYIDPDLYTGWYHGKIFKERMAEIGIICDDEGNHIHIDDSFNSVVREITN